MMSQVPSSSASHKSQVNDLHSRGLGQWRRWLDKRGPGYVFQRASHLLGRYGVTPARAVSRMEDTLRLLASYGCAPTLPTPGRVVEQHPGLIANFQAAGAEIAVHSYDHVDLSSYPVAEARAQLLAAAQVFRRNHIDVWGFRCPYLGYTDELLDSLPTDVFRYSSNYAVSWQESLSSVVEARRSATGRATPLPGTAPDTFQVLQRFYRPLAADEVACTPFLRWTDHADRGPSATVRGTGTSDGIGEALIEIPACIPDDLQLFDGLDLAPETVGAVWVHILRETHCRGELFTLLFHPELAALCQEPFAMLLAEANRLDPPVWMARLQDIAQWWSEKSRFSVEVVSTGEALPSGSAIRDGDVIVLQGSDGSRSGGVRIRFLCSKRAVVLVRGLISNRGCDDDVVPMRTEKNGELDPLLEQPGPGAMDAAGVWSSQGREIKPTSEGWLQYQSFSQASDLIIEVPGPTRPFVGLPQGATPLVLRFLEEQGYIIETGEEARRCSIVLDREELAAARTPRALVDRIERTPGPLVRYGRWPSGAASALAITGDLDALTLWDYASRLWSRPHRVSPAKARDRTSL